MHTRSEIAKQINTRGITRTPQFDATFPLFASDSHGSINMFCVLSRAVPLKACLFSSDILTAGASQLPIFCDDITVLLIIGGMLEIYLSRARSYVCLVTIENDSLGR